MKKKPTQAATAKRTNAASDKGRKVHALTGDRPDAPRDRANGCAARLRLLSGGMRRTRRTVAPLDVAPDIRHGMSRQAARLRRNTAGRLPDIRHRPDAPTGSRPHR